MCDIYFCVLSLTAVLRHYEDDDIDDASFSRHEDVTQSRVQTEGRPLTSSRVTTPVEDVILLCVMATKG